MIIDALAKPTHQESLEQETIKKQGIVIEELRKVIDGLLNQIVRNSKKNNSDMKVHKHIGAEILS